MSTDACAAGVRPTVRATGSLAVNLELMFTEADGPAGRVRAAAAAGIGEVEIWGWRSKDVGELRSSLDETGVRLLSLIVDPQLQLTDPATHDAFVVAVRETADVAETLDCPNLVVVAGDARPGVDPAEQHAAVVDALRRGVREIAGRPVRLLLENLNDRVDHVGTFVTLVEQGLRILREVDHPQVLLLLDAYHAVVMDEDVVAAVGDDVHLVGHVQVADAPGRNEPGTGQADWVSLLTGLRRIGYEGSFGMEYVPILESARSLETIRAIVEALPPAR